MNQLRDMRKPNFSDIKFAPYDIIKDRAFLVAAHSETFAITFKQEIKREWLEAELAKPREVRDGVYYKGELIGICDVSRRKDVLYGDYGRLNFIFVAPNYRDGGIGGQIIRHAASWCFGEGLETLALRTGKDNFRAQKCYDNNGFVRFTQIDTECEFGYVKRVIVRQNAEE
jgi:GNAT superfamily N-acetyltransferase